MFFQIKGTSFLLEVVIENSQQEHFDLRRQEHYDNFMYVVKDHSLNRNLTVIVILNSKLNYYFFPLFIKSILINLKSG
jgi:hypothetical protein